MSLPKYKDSESLTNAADIEAEILIVQKDLFNLRVKRSTTKEIKPHLFTHAKRRLSQLQFRKSLLSKIKN